MRARRPHQNLVSASTLCGAGVPPARRSLGMLAKPRAAEGPKFRPITQTGCHRISFGVFHKAFHRFLITNDMIEGLFLPDRTLPTQELVDLMRRKGLPAVQDCGQPVVMIRRDDDVNVIRHDAPGAQQVTNILEVQ